MKITITTGPMLPVPPLLGGAIPRLWQGLAGEFAQRGHSVTIFARAYPGQPPAETISGVHYLRWGGFSQGLSIAADLVKTLLFAMGAVWRLPPADILVTNDFWLPVFAPYIRPGAGKVVVNANRFPKGQFRLYQSAARIAAASTAVRNAIIRECPALAAKTRILPNPVDTHLMMPRANQRPSHGAKTLLYVGRLHPEKGVHLLLEAFSRLARQHPDWNLRLVGPIAVNQGGGGGDYQKRLADLAGTLPVEFAGPVFDSQKLVSFYQDADLFCYPSLAEKGESFGVAPLEAMACGVPPIVSDLECFRDYLVDRKSGWFFDHRGKDPAQSLADKLTEVMNAPDQIASVGRSAAEAARRFSYAAVAEQYLMDFTSLLKDTNDKGAM
jgi:glycosyltransferase involved in cell wall biosynthesis